MPGALSDPSRHPISNKRYTLNHQVRSRGSMRRPRRVRRGRRLFVRCVRRAPPHREGHAARVRWPGAGAPSALCWRRAARRLARSRATPTRSRSNTAPRRGGARVSSSPGAPVVRSTPRAAGGALRGEAQVDEMVCSYILRGVPCVKGALEPRLRLVATRGDRALLDAERGGDLGVGHLRELTQQDHVAIL